MHFKTGRHPMETGNQYQLPNTSHTCEHAVEKNAQQSGRFQTDWDEHSLVRLYNGLTYRSPMYVHGVTLKAMQEYSTQETGQVQVRPRGE